MLKFKAEIPARVVDHARKTVEKLLPQFESSPEKGEFEKKRRTSERLAQRTAFLLAFNSLNPVPGLDIAADMSLLLKLSRDILEVYGLKSEHIEPTIHKDLEDEALGVTLKRRLTRAVQSYVTQEGITAVLRLMAPRLEAKAIAKVVPVAGHGVAIFLGYHLTYTYGKKVVAEFEKLALKKI